MVWTNPDLIRPHVESLPPWADEWNDPNWVLEASEFGWINPCATIEEFDLLMVQGGPIVVEKLPLILIDPTWVLYTCQNLIRLDALDHYLHYDDLFDQGGMWGNDYPVISDWKDGYVVFDGNHRLTANKMLNRPTYVLYHSSQI